MYSAISTLLKHAGSSWKMTSITNMYRLLVQQPWTADHLICECSTFLGVAIDNSTANTYTFAINLYLTFCRLYSMPINPTPEILSHYIYHISKQPYQPMKSVKFYLTFYSVRQGHNPLMRIKQMKMRLKMTSVSHRMRSGKKKVGRVCF